MDFTFDCKLAAEIVVVAVAVFGPWEWAMIFAEWVTRMVTEVRNGWSACQADSLLHRLDYC